MKPVLKPGKPRKNKKKIYGFDIETHTTKNTFLCASIVGDNYTKTCYSIKEVIHEFQNHRYRNSIIAATNLSFDFFGVFTGQQEMQAFRTLFRGSHLLFAKTWLDNKSKFFYKNSKEQKAQGTITFLDTLNYAQLSVKDMGDILNIPKLDLADGIGKKPRTKKEWKKMIEYNIRDAQITRKFTKFLYDGFETLGASPKLTMASTAMSLFRNKYLNRKFWVHPQETILEIMKGYYGGRTEAFQRGKFYEKNYYDINSMYPYCMTKPLPDPNTLRTNNKGQIRYIMEYEGMSNVTIECPLNLKIPYLPYRWQGKLIFPTGELSGWYTHFELRKAISMGYTIKKIQKTHYYLWTCTPLKEYVNDLYTLRLEAKKQKSRMQLVYKLCLNTLYGKFAQKFLDKEVYTPVSNFSYEQIQNMTSIERIGDFIRHKKDLTPPHFCIPIWAAYITAYARDLLYSYLSNCDPLYCDTDSIITSSKLPETTDLGGMKLEMKIQEGVIIKPKMYALKDYDKKDHIKIKGIRKKILIGDKEVLIDYPIFIGLQEKNSLVYRKFTKFKEAMRRGMTVNEVIPILKELDLNDSKRSWNEKLSWTRSHRSLPLVMIDGMESEYRKRLMRKAHESAQENVKKDMLAYLNSDVFDSHSVGCDISSEEFMLDEQWFEQRSL